MGNQAQKKPKKAEKKTDLPGEVEGTIRVIPDRKPKPVIDDDPANKFQLGDQHRRKQGFEKKLPFAQGGMNEVDGAKADSAQNTHGKMGVPSKKDLDQGIDHASAYKAKQIYRCFFHIKPPELNVF